LRRADLIKAVVESILTLSCYKLFYRVTEKLVLAIALNRGIIALFGIVLVSILFYKYFIAHFRVFKLLNTQLKA
jgi:hypothetical protein